MTSQVTLAFIWLFCSRVVQAYPGGAPDLACVSMFPSGHMTTAQLSEPPYRISVSKKTYNPGETIKVEIVGLEESFTGLYVQPRQVGCHLNATRIVGVFTASSPDLQTRHCFGVVHSTVTHTSKDKQNRASFYWTAPVTPSGHVVIRATLVKDFQHFWTEVESAPIIDLHNKDMPACVSHEHKDGFNFDHNAGNVSFQAKKSKIQMINSGFQNIASICFFLAFLQMSLVLVRKITVYI
ncbi:putative defense protein 3 [Biomphalaria glabrata]|uniref:Defense protein 3 n=1 Tax=Biomphalaria glabrata TaxID=6526 RepID=A0A9W3AD29_BIOGL|nr:putative defense protein 3 [Biomphalaria glabrata]